MTSGFDLTNFGSVSAPVTPKAKPVVAYHVEESEVDNDPVLPEPTNSETKEVNGHTIKRNSGKTVSTETGLLKEIYSPNPQVNPLPDEVVDRNIKAGVL